MASIIVTTGKQKGDYFQLDLEINVIGRSETLNIQISDEHVSRRHMKIYFDRNKACYFATDIGSSHGVFINGLKLNNDTALNDGDYITIGITNLLFTLRDFANRESAMSYFEKVGAWEYPVFTESSLTASTGINPDTWVDSKGHDNIQNFEQWTGSSRLTLVIVFTDIVGSTLLTHKLGNERMTQVRLAHFRQARNLINRFNGFEIKTIGDEFMVAFRTAVDALDFVLALHTDTGDHRIQIRAGIHVGPVVIEEQDAHGSAVSFASRVMNMAIEGGVWLSNDAKNHIDQEKATRHENLQWQNHLDCELKGFPGKHQLWSIEDSV